MLESWKACILVAEKSELWYTKAKMYCCLWRILFASRKILQRYFVGRFSFHLLYLSGAHARRCCTIYFQDFAIAPGSQTFTTECTV